MAPSVTSLSTAYTEAELGTPSHHYGPTQIRNQMISRVALAVGEVGLGGLVALGVWFNAYVLLTHMGVIQAFNPAAIVDSFLSY